MCCAVPAVPCGAYPSSTYTFSPGGNVEMLAGVEPGEELDPQAATRGSNINNINVSQKVDFFSIAFSLLCSHSSHEVIWNSETFPFRPSSRRFCTSGGLWQ